MNYTCNSLLNQPTAIVVILLSPPSAQYLYFSTVKDRLNHTLNSLAIGPELAQPTATVTTPLRTQIPTPRIPRPSITLIPQPIATAITPSST